MSDETEKKPVGWQDDILGYLKEKAHGAIDDLHDRIVFTTKAKKTAIDDAMNDGMPQEKKEPSGFQKIKNEK